MLSTLKASARRIAYVSGSLARYHRRRNAGALTVIGFHRVLPRGDAAWDSAMPEYSVRSDFFEDALHFFRAHYSIVDMGSVVRARQGESTLPAHPLTITFDDGWVDNLEHALPILERHGVPATVFVTARGNTGERTFWREELFAGFRTLGVDAVTEAWQAAVGDPVPTFDSGYAAIEAAERLDSESRDALLMACDVAAGGRIEARMMDPDELRRLAESLSVGGHGLVHEWLTEASDAGQELAASRAELRELLGSDGEPGMSTMSFPHGRYDPSVVQAGRDTGFALMCTSDQCLNLMDQGRPASDVVGRTFATREWMARDGAFRPDLAANVLFRAPIVALDGSGPTYV